MKVESLARKNKEQAEQSSVRIAELEQQVAEGEKVLGKLTKQNKELSLKFENEARFGVHKLQLIQEERSILNNQIQELREDNADLQVKLRETKREA